VFRQNDGKGYTLAQLLCRPENDYAALLAAYPEGVKDHGSDINFQIELQLKYAGYINRQYSEIEKLSHVESIRIPADFIYETIAGLRTEARQKLIQYQPSTLGQASRLAGVSPADLSVLMIALEKKSREEHTNGCDISE
jgi:tRNA uridine 5-carboxymethylaminomethyl modification enzyme